MKAYRLVVVGRVQGVGFRRSVQQLARQFKLVGEVKNRDDGDVEIMVQGEDERIGEFIGNVKNIPSPAKVESIEKISIDPNVELRVFKIAHGAIPEELDEGLRAGQEQLSLLRDEFAKFSTNTATNFNTLATRYDKVSDGLVILTDQSKKFTETLITLTNLAKDYFDERRAQDAPKSGAHSKS